MLISNKVELRLKVLVSMNGHYKIKPQFTKKVLETFKPA